MSHGGSIYSMEISKSSKLEVFSPGEPIAKHLLVQHLIGNRGQIDTQIDTCIHVYIPTHIDIHTSVYVDGSTLFSL